MLTIFIYCLPFFLLSIVHGFELKQNPKTRRGYIPQLKIFAVSVCLARVFKRSLGYISGRNITLDLPTHVWPFSLSGRWKVGHWRVNVKLVTKRNSIYWMKKQRDNNFKDVNEWMKSFTFCRHKTTERNYRHDLKASLLLGPVIPSYTSNFLTLSFTGYF